MPIHDLACDACDTFLENVPVVSGAFPACESCGREMRWVPTKMNTDEWGQSRYIKSLDREFSSKGELRRYLKKNNLMEAGDPVGGARTTVNPPTPWKRTHKVERKRWPAGQ